MAGLTVPYCAMGLEAVGSISRPVPQPRDQCLPLLCPGVPCLSVDLISPFLGMQSQVPQLLPANEWKSNYCHPIPGPCRWVSLVAELSLAPSLLICFYQQCNAEELIPVWGWGEGGWCGRARV